MKKGMEGDIATPKKRAAASASASTSNTTKKESGSLVDLNFKVPAEIKRAFKVLAAEHDMTQKQLLLKAIDLLDKQFR